MWFVIILMYATGLKADKRGGREVAYVAGTFTEIHVGCTGRLDARDPKELLIICGGERLAIPQSAIVSSRIVSTQQDARDLGIPDVMITPRKDLGLVYIRTAREVHNSNWLLLELPAVYARKLVVYIIRAREDRDAKDGATTQ